MASWRGSIIAPDPEYAYTYDDIGNRISSLDLGTNRTYTANALNQYTSISGSVGDPPAQTESFAPQFDLDGNQTLIRTSTGVWSVTYNAENRPVLWSCGITNIVMAFDRMGRRVEYLETSPTSQTSQTITNTHHRFVYDGYVCIQRLDAAANNAIDFAFGWDPTEPVATRPLWIQRPTGNYNFFCFHDGNKNVSDVVSYQSAYGVAAHYEYAPFGAVTVAINCAPPASTAFNAATTNPFRFSSEYADDALGLMYYNYRHYDPIMGRWTSDDPGEFSLNLYAFVNNDPALVDWEGLAPVRFCNSSDLSNSGIVSEQNMDASRMQPFEMKGVEGKSILSAGQVMTSKPNIKICCKCIPQNKGGPLYQLRYEGKMTVKMYLTSPNAVYKGSTRSPEGYNRTMAHERLHIQNITQKFESMVKEKIGNGDELMTREQCAEKMRGIDLKKITTEWETMLQDDMFHRGDEWDEWRKNNGGKSWIDEGEW